MRVRLPVVAATCSVILLALAAWSATGAAQSSTGGTMGVGSVIPAYYDSTLFSINLSPLGPASTLLSKNTQDNNIWMSSAVLPGGQPFVAVIDAIQADGFNPLWAGNTITFNPGVTPFQIFSDDGVADAIAKGLITSTPTGVMFRCAVIGKPSASLRGTAGEAGASSPTTSSWGRVKTLYR